MASGFRLFTKRFLLAINIFIVSLFLLSCLAPYLDPEKWWFISVLGLAFPFLLIAVVLFFIFWLLQNLNLSFSPLSLYWPDGKALAASFCIEQGA